MITYVHKIVHVYMRIYMHLCVYIVKCDLASCFLKLKWISHDTWQSLSEWRFCSLGKSTRNMFFGGFSSAILWFDCQRVSTNVGWIIQILSIRYQSKYCLLFFSRPFDIFHITQKYPAGFNGMRSPCDNHQFSPWPRSWLCWRRKNWKRTGARPAWGGFGWIWVGYGW